MTNKEKEKIDKLISKLDSCCGKLIVIAMKDNLVKEAMEEVSEVSFELGNLL